MVKGLSDANAIAIIAAWALLPFQSIENLWRRAQVPVAALAQIAEADGFRPSLGLARRDAIWAIRVLHDEPLPLFTAAADRLADETPEPAIALRPMAAGGEVIEDYRHVGLSLRDHPVTFLRQDHRRRGVVSCQAAMDACDGRWLEAAGIVLVRQRPARPRASCLSRSRTSGIANLVVGPKVFERFRRTVLSASMIAVRRRIQREGEVVHLWAQRLADLSGELAEVGKWGQPFPLPHGRGDEFHHSSPTPARSSPRACRVRRPR
jgi:error-prone DNA polymerase